MLKFVSSGEQRGNVLTFSGGWNVVYLHPSLFFSFRGRGKSGRERRVGGKERMSEEEGGREDADGDQRARPRERLP